MSKVKRTGLDLKEEVKLLRSFVIGTVGKDLEGEYQPEYVEKVLQALTDEPGHEFKRSEDFLRQLRKTP